MELSVGIIPTNNVNILRLSDESTYDGPTQNGVLSIMPPGFMSGVIFSVAQGFNFIANSSNLGIAPINLSTDGFVPLADGIYVIRLSVETTTNNFVEYNHMRVTCITKEWMNQLCSVNLQPCNNLESKQEERLEELYLIKSYIDSAVAKTEVCNSPAEGIQLLDYARKRLNKFATKKACSFC